MAQQIINIGTIANDGTGDTLRDAGDKCNDNFTELYTGLTGLLDFKGSTDCSANPNYPTASKGDYYLVSVAGKIGGASGVVVSVGDSYFAIDDNAGGTQAAVGTSWTVVEGNIGYAPVNKAGDTMSGDLIVPDEAYDAAAWNGSLEVPTKNAVRDKIEAVIAGGGSFTAASTTEQLTGTDTTKGSTSDSVAALWEQGSDVASSGTISIGEGGYFNITGTTTITDIDFGTDRAGRKVWVKFAGILTLTHNASTLILPTSANITTAAGDTACFVSEGSDAVRCVSYNRASGAALTSSSSTPWDYSPPTAASMSLVSGDATNLTLADDSDIGLTVSYGSPAASIIFRTAYRTLTTKASDWTLVARIKRLHESRNYRGEGLVIMDSIGGKAISFECRNDTGVAVFEYNNLTGTFSASLYGSTNLTVLGGQGVPVEWQRIVHTGGNYLFDVSANGKQWMNLASVGDTAFLANRADRVGIVGVAMNAGGPTLQFSVPYFSLTGPGV